MKLTESDGRLSDYDLSISDPDLVAGLRSADLQANKRIQLALEQSGYAGFLNSMLTPDQQRRARGEETDVERNHRVAYEMAVRQTQEMLADMREASSKAIKQAEENVRRTQELLDTMRASASRTADGRIVFRTKDGTKGFFEDGTQMPADDFKRQQWEKGATPWEDWQSMVERDKAARRTLDEAKAYGERVDYYSKRMANGDLSADELNDIQKDLKAAPLSVQADMPFKADSINAANAGGLSGDFNLSADELAEIKAASTHNNPKNNPDFSP